MTEALILIVNNNHANLEKLAQQLGEEGYATVGASSLEEMDSITKGQENIKLALLDPTGFDKGIWERCGQLHEAKIPFIIITSQRSPSIKRDSLKCGANGLLVKPLGTKELIEHMHAALGD
jgi:DNA-binding response OmpR family regulator